MSLFQIVKVLDVDRILNIVRLTIILVILRLTMTLVIWRLLMTIAKFISPWEVEWISHLVGSILRDRERVDRFERINRFNFRK